MPAKRNIITGPDMDRMADGIHKPTIEALTQRVTDLTAQKAELRAEARKLRKQLRGAMNHQETLLRHNAECKAAREKLTFENNVLKARLLNVGVKLDDS